MPCGFLTQNPRSRRGTAASAVAVVASAALAACGSAAAPGVGAETSLPDGQVAYGWIGPSMDGKSPGDAIVRAGLRLPRSAKVTSMVAQGLEGREEAYVYTFEVSRAVAEEFCGSGGLGGAGPVSVIPPQAKEAFHDVAVTAASRGCGGAVPSDPRWFRFVLIDGGDPAVTRLVLQYASR